VLGEERGHGLFGVSGRNGDGDVSIGLFYVLAIPIPQPFMSVIVAAQFSLFVNVLIGELAVVGFVVVVVNAGGRLLSTRREWQRWTQHRLQRS